MFQILIADSLPANILEKYNQQDDITIENRAGISKAELQEIISQYNGLVVRSRTKVTADILEKATRLQVVGRAGAGMDNIDISEATRRGIIVMNTPGGNTIAAAEHTIALLLSTLRNVPQANTSIRQGQWDRKTYMGHELFEKTIGIIGLGKIGREVAKRLAAFGTRLLGYDPILTQELAEQLGIQLVDFQELLNQSDIISLHAPKTPETLNMIDAETLNHCKKGVILINCARGGLINEQDLISALDSGQVRGAAIDVFPEEPPSNWEVAKHPKIVATPHLGASTEEAQIKVADQILKQMTEYFKKNVAINAANFISVEEDIQPIITPYFSLATHLGHLSSQIRTSRLKKIMIRVYGDVLKLPADPITSHLVAGALRPNNHANGSLNVDHLNMVNAMTIAREKGIDIEISPEDQLLTSHNNLLACDFITETETMHLAGTVYAKGIYRLVKFNQYRVDAELFNKMIIIKNKDIPGIIGKVGTLLAEDHINIGHVSSGRIKTDQTAVNVFNVDGDWNADIRKKLENIEHINQVFLVDLKG